MAFNELRAIATFTKAAELGSLRAAAAAQAITPQAASQALGQLEAFLGVRLFHRTTRRLSLRGGRALSGERPARAGQPAARAAGRAARPAADGRPASHRGAALTVETSPEVPAAPQGAWLGYVVPKRHAKRAVTRVLLKRQIRAVFDDLGELPPGLWVVRLRMPFDRKQFPSASSDALRAAARAELQQLTRKLARPPAGG